ncbi:MAG: hypothetical protein IKU99_05265 [Clostridia bacterium]|nr:hypothetical protein [Clostridia bacterium]
MKDFKFPGYRRIASLFGRVHLILPTEKYIYVHAGCGLYKIPREVADLIKRPRPIAYLEDKRSIGISLGDRIILSDGKGILAIDALENLRILSYDSTLASCRAMAIWDGRLFLGGFDGAPDLVYFSAPLRGGLPRNLTDGEIWLDGILGIEKMTAGEELYLSGQGGVMAISSSDGSYSHTKKSLDERAATFRGMELTLDGESMTLTDREDGISYTAHGIAGFDADRRVYNYSSCAKDGYFVHKSPHTPCGCEVMSLIDRDGEMIYFSEEGGKRYALYRTEIMAGGSPLKSTAYLIDGDRLWIGNEAGGLYLMGGEDEDGLFDRHMPEITTTKEQTNE